VLFYLILSIFLLWGSIQLVNRKET